MDTLMPYFAWLDEVAADVATAGRVLQELPEVPLSDWHDAGVTPATAAGWAIEGESATRASDFSGGVADVA